MTDEQLIDGVAISDSILDEVKDQVLSLASLSEKNLYEKILSNNVEQERIANPSIANQSDGLKLVEPPHLVVVVVGERADSLTYVKKKVQACKKLGIKSTTLRIESSVTQQELIDLINQLNDPNNDIDGVLIQVRFYFIWS